MLIFINKVKNSPGYPLMTGMQGKCFSYPQRIGEDRILRKGKQLVVCSKVDMGEWKVREIRKTVIYINDEAWCLVAKQFSAKEEVRYILDPWPDIASEIPGRIIRYDEEYVSARDNAVKKMRLEARIGPTAVQNRFEKSNPY